MTEEQIKHMVDRFLMWKLPENFNPDGGIRFKAEYNVEWNAKQGKPPQRHEPFGTNLFDAVQAEAMVRHMIEGLPAQQAQTLKPCKKNPSVYCNCEGFYPACFEAPASAEPEDIGRPVPKHGSGP
ncbi:hypothetical protein [Mesorhizobium sp.]|uniref:hypothetical protein n=1 Tax=Mesorhizobium sp. TaxID=1871066 RepID=UPI0025BBD15B|nr:hypothetical protein [Mesorhizobium sp.]